MSPRYPAAGADANCWPVLISTFSSNFRYDIAARKYAWPSNSAAPVVSSCSRCRTIRQGRTPVAQNVRHLSSFPRLGRQLCRLRLSCRRPVLRRHRSSHRLRRLLQLHPLWLRRRHLRRNHRAVPPPGNSAMPASPALTIRLHRVPRLPPPIRTRRLPQPGSRSRRWDIPQAASCHSG